MQNPLFKRLSWANSTLTLLSPTFDTLPSLLIIGPKRKLRKNNFRKRSKKEWSHHLNGSGTRSGTYRAMPCSLIETSNSSCGGGGGGEQNGRLRNFKLNESTFLASLMPKKEIAADRFVEAHPHYDGRGALIAIFGTTFDFLLTKKKEKNSLEMKREGNKILILEIVLVIRLKFLFFQILVLTRLPLACN